MKPQVSNRTDGFVVSTTLGSHRGDCISVGFTVNRCPVMLGLNYQPGGDKVSAPSRGSGSRIKCPLLRWETRASATECWHGEHGTSSSSHHARRCRSEESSPNGVTGSDAHHDDIGIHICRDARDFGRRVARHHTHKNTP